MKVPAVLRKLLKTDEAVKPEPMAETDFRKQLDMTKMPAVSMRFELDWCEASSLTYSERQKLEDDAFDKFVLDNDLAGFVRCEKTDLWDRFAWKTLEFTLDGHLVRSRRLTPNPAYDEAVARRRQLEEEEQRRKALLEPYSPEAEILTIWRLPLPFGYTTTPNDDLKPLPIMAEYPAGPRKIGLVERQIGMTVRVAVEVEAYTQSYPSSNCLYLGFMVAPNNGIQSAKVQLPLSKAKELRTKLDAAIARFEAGNP